MSFILDALKKSESERQEQTGADFSSVPSRPGEPQSFKWLWILALLLAVNVIVLLGVLLRPGTVGEAPPPVTVPDEQGVESAAAIEPSFEEQIAEARQARSEREAAERESATSEPADEAVSAPVPARPARAGRVRTIDELRLNGSLQITDLHLDIHVYSEVPAERFVFINMEKYRESEQLEEGPVVDEITSDGVILDYQGMTFLLPRE